MPLKPKAKRLTDKTPFMAQGAKCNQCPYKARPCVPDIVGNGEHIIMFDTPTNSQARKQSWLQTQNNAGKLFDVALSYNDCRDINIVGLIPCQAPDPANISQKAVDCCAPRREALLKGQKRVLSVGKAVNAELLPNLKSSAPKTLRGAFYEVDNLEVLPTIPLDFIADVAPDEFPDFINDLGKLFKPRLEVPDPQILLVGEVHEDVAPHLPPCVALGDIDNAIDELLAWDGDMVFDFETSNRDMETSQLERWWENYILTCGFSIREGHAIVFTETAMNDPDTLMKLKPVFERKQGLTGHNVKFDCMQIFSYFHFRFDIKLDILITHDTLNMSHVLDERGQRHSLKYITRLFDQPDYDDDLKKHLPKAGASYAFIPRQHLYFYVAQDVDFTLRFLNIFTPQLKEQGLYEWPYKRVIVPALNLFVEIQTHGFYVDPDKFENAQKYLLGLKNDYAEQLQTIVDENGYIAPKGKPYNPNSHVHNAGMLYDIFQLPQLRGKGINIRGTGEPALNGWLTQGVSEQIAEFIKTLQMYRKYAKLVGTYINSVQYFCDDDGVYHGDFNPAAAKTGRVGGGTIMTIPASYNPTGKIIREMYVSPPVKALKSFELELLYNGATPEHDNLILLDADFSQAELRFAGWQSKDPFLHGVYNNDNDLHSAVAQVIAGDSWQKQDRSIAKQINFAYLYSLKGSGAKLLVDTTGIDLHTAETIIDKHSHALTVCEQWKDDQFLFAQNNAYVMTATGRKRRFPVITRRNENDVKKQSVNAPIQGVSSDVTLLAMYTIWQEFVKKKIPAYPIMFLHDGVYFAMSQDDPSMVLEAMKIVKLGMEATALNVMLQAPKKWPEIFGGCDPIKFKADVEAKTAWAGGQTLFAEHTETLAKTDFSREIEAMLW